MVRDRVAQNAIKAVIEPIFERDFSENSHGFRPGRKCSDALSAVDTHLAEGFCCVVDADVEGFFDNVCHERLMGLVREKIADGKVLAMIERSLKQNVMEGMKEWRPEKGTPQGAVLSPLLANIYMHGMQMTLSSVARHWRTLNKHWRRFKNGLELQNCRFIPRKHESPTFACAMKGLPFSDTNTLGAIEQI